MHSKSPLLVVGTSQSVESDLQSIADLSRFKIMAINRALLLLERVDIFATTHALGRPWVQETEASRVQRGWNTDYMRVGWPTHPLDCSRGSSSLYGVMVGLEAGFTRIVVAGVSLEGDYSRFREGWLRKKKELAPYVRGVSGFLADEFGVPDASWLTEKFT